MADWRARLLPASWRGIPFFIDEHTFSSGRNAKGHEPVQRQNALSEDMGVKGETFSITGHVLGDDYFFTRDALIKALKDEGKGTLIHPFLGAKEVQAVGFEVNESIREGRIAYFQMTFIEAGEPSFPFAAIDAVIDAITAVTAVIAQIKNAYQLAVTVAGIPAFVIETLKNSLDSLADLSTEELRKVRLVPEEQSTTILRASTIKDNSTELAQNPASASNEVDALIDGLRDVVPEAPDNNTIDTSFGRDDQIEIFRAFINYDSGAGDIIETTPTRTTEKNNLLALEDMVRQFAIMRASTNALGKDFKSIADAVALRNELTAAIDAQLKNDRIDDELFKLLSAYKGKLVNAIPNRRTGNQSIKTITQNEALPAIALSYELYGSVDFDDDIANRNAIRNPVFCQGELEVAIND